MPNEPGGLVAESADRYRIERELGAGGMATVHAAHDLKHDRLVALKVLRPEIAAMIGSERFLREIRAGHPGRRRRRSRPAPGNCRHDTGRGYTGGVAMNRLVPVSSSPRWTGPVRRQLVQPVTLGLLAVAAFACARDAGPDVVDFEVSEGTNLAFDIAPDGEAIVFDMLGQLWVMPAGGGRARPITDAVRDTAEDVDPVFSPDGEWIVFQGDRPAGRGLWLIRTDGGKPRRITPEGVEPDFNTHMSPAWSPDGKEIAFALRDTLYRVDVATASVRVVPVEFPDGSTSLPGMGAPAWSPDGERLAFNTGAPLAFNTGVAADARIWDVRAEGGNARPITPDGVRAVAPAYSPVGTRIAYLASDSGDAWQLRVQPVGGGPAGQLTHGANMVVRRVRWTADAAALLYAADGRLRRIEAAGGSPAEIPFVARIRFERQRATLPAVRFAEPGTEQPVRGFSGLAISPDGARIAMLALGRLWVWDVGANPRAVADVPEGALDISWSSDGTRVVFRDESPLASGPAGQRAVSGDLLATDVESGITLRLTAFPGAEEAPVWSPDGRYIAFRHEDRVRLIQPREGTAADLSGTIDLGPVRGRRGLVWSPDSRALLMYTPLGRAVMVGLDGESLTLDRFPSAAQSVRWPVPDTLVYVHGNRLWRAAFDRDSGTIGDASPISDDAAMFVSVASNGAVLYVSEDGLRLRAPDGRVRPLGWPLRFRVPDAPPPLLVRNARIIDGTGAPTTPPSEILIRDGRIAAISPVGSSGDLDGVAIMDAGGRTVMPGLIDLHRHLIPDWFGGIPQIAGALYHGVTTVRDVGSAVNSAAALRDGVESGRWPGPRIIYGGFTFLGSDRGDGGPTQQLVAESEQIARGMKLARAFGADYAKYYGLSFAGDWAVGVSMIREAHRNGMRVSGHCATTLPLVAAAIDGQEHAGRCNRDWQGISEDFARLKAEAGIWVVPTAGVALTFMQLRDDPTILERPDVAPFLGGLILSAHDTSRASTWLGERDHPTWLASTSRLHDSGVLIAAGTDHYLPGALHTELEALVEAGLSPLEAVTAATANAARVLGAEAEIGTLEVGKLADLVILDADPVTDIRNTRRISQVILGGRIVDRDSLLERVRALPSSLERIRN